MKLYMNFCMQKPDIPERIWIKGVLTTYRNVN